MSERLPLIHRDIQRLQKVGTRGREQDFLRLLTTDMVTLYDDFLGKAIDTTVKWTTGGAGTAAAVPTSAKANGETALVTGAATTQGSSLYSAQLQWSPNNDCLIVARIKVSAITLVKVEVGFTDSAASAVIGAAGLGSVNSLAATPTLNTGASDAVCAICDAGSALATPMNWRLVAAKAGTTQLATPSNTVAALKAPVADTYQTIAVVLRRIELGATDDSAAYLYVNGVEMAKINSAAVTATATLNPYIIVATSNGGSTSRTLTCDYIDVRQYRDYALA